MSTTALCVAAFIGGFLGSAAPAAALWWVNHHRTPRLHLRWKAGTDERR